MIIGVNWKKVIKETLVKESQMLLQFQSFSNKEDLKSMITSLIEITDYFDNKIIDMEMCYFAALESQISMLVALYTNFITIERQLKSILDVIDDEKTKKIIQNAINVLNDRIWALERIFKLLISVVNLCNELKIKDILTIDMTDEIAAERQDILQKYLKNRINMMKDI